MTCDSKNKSKGQSLIEAVIVFNIMIFIFFNMMTFTAFYYHKLLAMYACNIAINEAVGKIPLLGSSMTESDLEDMTRLTANNIATKGTWFKKAFSCNVKVTKDLGIDPNGRFAEIQIHQSIRFETNMPFASLFLDGRRISHKAEVLYSW